MIETKKSNPKESLKISISNLEPAVHKDTQTKLESHFSKFGHIKSINLSKVHNKRKQSAILEVAHKRTYESILSSEHSLDGIRLTVTPFRSQTISGIIKIRFSGNIDNFEKDLLKERFGQFGVIKEFLVEHHQSAERDREDSTEDSISGFVVFKDREAALEILNLGNIAFEMEDKVTKERTSRSLKVSKFEEVALKEEFDHSLRAQTLKSTKPLDFPPQLQGDVFQKKRMTARKQSEHGKKELHLEARTPNTHKEELSEQRDEQPRDTSQEITESKETPIETQAGYLNGEFLPPDQLEKYLSHVYESNPHFDNKIKKKFLKFLELFYYNEKQRNRDDYRKKNVSYYTMVKRIIDKVEKNHGYANMRFNKSRSFFGFINNGA